MERDLRRESAKERARRARWEAKALAKVIHPAYGAVVVPCSSPLGAVKCAAEYWHCKWAEITDAEVWAAKPEDGPAVSQYII